MAEDDSGSNTEAPTAQRLVRARDEGNIAQSRELHLLSSLGFATLALTMALPEGSRDFVIRMRGLMANSSQIDLDPESVAKLSWLGVRMMLVVGAPIVAAASLGGVATALLQSGFLLRMEALIPDIGRLNPLSGIKRIFSVNNAVEVIKSLVKIGIFSFLLFGVIRDTLSAAMVSPGWTVELFTRQLYGFFIRSVATILAVQAIIVVLDEGWTRYRRMQDLRMSRHDIRDEMRQSEGDPHVKGRLRQIRMSRSRKRIREAVKTATVVVTNPTHYAVALAYDSGVNAAPRVVAKGADELAARIREFAYEARVPVVSNPPLARSLYTLPEDAEIPYEYFQAVAAIIAYVWKLKKPASNALPPVH
ncbi:flagellar biosynthesis protein FlhB [Acetobacter sp. DsW_063]|uniref:EscU/YscU/HrcU family type III secretion system export apparatus switch protein n=1 Tax=Acetobacter sp. DsW_063 TaxID=1514894 RepID=UPI000A394F3D|nr:flagellar type III secretion system protein FlhB [Acetobacter sp. DsW_063]OUJ14214.1 hypothetical protein HK28_00420 [Acetobacter sp. DsW_063]